MSKRWIWTLERGRELLTLEAALSVSPSSSGASEGSDCHPGLIFVVAFYLFIFRNFIYFILAALGLHGCTWAFFLVKVSGAPDAVQAFSLP